MMNILLIEDDLHKASQIIDFVKEGFPGDSILHMKSYQSGLKEIVLNPYDLILLDMQLPNFDIKFAEDGYKFRKLAGIDILREISRKKRACKVIVVTQFETFGEGDTYIDLISLRKTLENLFFETYIDTVFYGADLSVWQKELSALIISNFKRI